MARKKKPWVDRFWDKVDKTGDCWIWTGSKHKFGYGTFPLPELGLYNSHRISWFLENGPIKNGMVVCHKCDIPECVNPKHLFLGTPAENVRDCIAKGRLRNGSLRGPENGNVKNPNLPVGEILTMYENGVHVRKLAEIFGVGKSTVSNIVRGEHWSNGVSAKRQFGRIVSQRQARQRDTA